MSGRFYVLTQGVLARLAAASAVARRPSERGITVNDKNLEASSEFVRVAGLRFDEIGGERVRGSIELGERHHTPWGVVHGASTPRPSKARPASGLQPRSRKGGSSP